MLKFEMEDLTGEDFSEVELQGVQFISCNMTDVLAEESDLTDGRISDCLLTGVRVKNTTLDGVEIREAEGKEIRFRDCPMRAGFSLRESTLVGLSLEGCGLEDITFAENTIKGVQLTHTSFNKFRSLRNTLSEADNLLVAQSCFFELALFSSSDLSYAVFNNCTLNKVSFSSTILDGVSFEKGSVSRLRLHSPIPLKDMKFAGHDITDARMESRIELERAELRHCSWEVVSNESFIFLNAEISKSYLRFGEGSLTFTKSNLSAVAVEIPDLSLKDTWAEGSSFLVEEGVFTHSTLRSVAFPHPRNVKKLTFIDCRIEKIDFTMFKKTQLEFINTNTSSCVF